MMRTPAAPLLLLLDEPTAALDLPWVFASDDAHHQRVGAGVLDQRFRRVRTEAGIDALLHRLRHSLATFLGVAVRSFRCKLASGTADAATTLREYALVTLDGAAVKQFADEWAAAPPRGGGRRMGRRRRGVGSISAGLVQAFSGEPTSFARILTIIGPTVVTLWLLAMASGWPGVDPLTRAGERSGAGLERLTALRTVRGKPASGGRWSASFRRSAGNGDDHDPAGGR